MPTETEPGDWSVPDVYVLTQGEQGRVAIPGLELHFVAQGIELVKQDGELAWRCAWDALDVLSTAGHSIMPDGRTGVVVVMIEHGGRQHRFVLPAVDAAEVQAAVQRSARVHRIQTFEPPSAVSRTLTVAVVLAAIATVTVLLLSAAHVLHF